jgi:hypothetical protein
MTRTKNTAFNLMLERDGSQFLAPAEPVELIVLIDGYGTLVERKTARKPSRSEEKSTSVSIGRYQMLWGHRGCNLQLLTWNTAWPTARCMYHSPWNAKLVEKHLTSFWRPNFCHSLQRLPQLVNILSHSNTSHGLLSY